MLIPKHAILGRQCKAHRPSGDANAKVRAWEEFVHVLALRRLGGNGL